jgi:ribokinase
MCGARIEPNVVTSARPGPVVVAGSHGQSLFLRVDSIPVEGETVLAYGFDEPEDGGKASNQAVAVAKLGCPVRLLTALGDDERGARWLKILNGHGVDMRYALEVPGPTDVGFVMLPPSRIPAIASSRDLSLSLDDRAISSRSDAFLGASVVVCQLEALQSCAIASFRLARSTGATTILNPAPAADLDSELLSLTDILVPNEHEAAGIDGSGAPLEELASRLVERFGCAVVVTAGVHGCYVDAPRITASHIPALKVSVVDTTGAGDAFVGALAVRLRAGDSLTDAAVFATRCASISVAREGTMPSYATAAEAATALTGEPPDPRL